MKRIVPIIIYVISSIILYSCTKNDDNDNMNSQDGNRYYIKYEVSSTSKDPGGVLASGRNFDQTYTFTTEKGTETIKKSGSYIYSWEGTYGPFKKGDKVSLSVSSARVNHAIISASRNQEPFVIKAEKNTENKEISLSYTIDF